MDYDYKKDIIEFEEKNPGVTVPKVDLPNSMKPNAR